MCAERKQNLNVIAPVLVLALTLSSAALADESAGHSAGGISIGEGAGGITDRAYVAAPPNYLYVIDAKVILGVDRRSVEDRMATIFDVKYSDDSKIHDRTPVWHNVSEEFCGITFDYGKKYQVHARWGDNGELETDQCLMGE